MVGAMAVRKIAAPDKITAFVLITVPRTSPDVLLRIRGIRFGNSKFRH
jgi:hypothetical protein